MPAAPRSAVESREQHVSPRPCSETERERTCSQLLRSPSNCSRIRRSPSPPAVDADAPSRSSSATRFCSRATLYSYSARTLSAAASFSHCGQCTFRQHRQGRPRGERRHCNALILAQHRPPRSGHCCPRTRQRTCCSSHCCSPRSRGCWCWCPARARARARALGRGGGASASPTLTEAGSSAPRPRREGRRARLPRGRSGRGAPGAAQTTRSRRCRCSDPPVQSRARGFSGRGRSSGWGSARCPVRGRWARRVTAAAASAGARPRRASCSCWARRRRCLLGRPPSTAAAETPQR